MDAVFECLLCRQPKANPDKNATAEMAFRACETEERALSSHSARAGVPPDIFAYLWSQTKKILVNTK